VLDRILKYLLLKLIETQWDTAIKLVLVYLRTSKR